MSEIATYKCTNRLCGYTVRRSYNLHCGDSLHIERVGLNCPHCHEGTLAMPRLSVLH